MTQQEHFQDTITFEQMPVLLSEQRDEIMALRHMLIETNEMVKRILQPDPLPDLMTIKQAGEYLSLTTPTMYNKVSRNQLPYMKRGKKLYFSRAELTEYLKAGRNKTADELIEEVESYLEIKKKGGRA